jgi:Zn-dependent metalloprotease
MAIGGLAWEKAGRIWYETVRDPRVTEGTKFAEFAAVTIDVANRIPGIKKPEATAVADAWAEVGVSVTS